MIITLLIMKNRRTWTDEQLIEAVKVSKYLNDVYRFLNICISNDAVHKLIKNRISELNLDVSHIKAYKEKIIPTKEQLIKVVQNAKHITDIINGFREITKQKNNKYTVLQILKYNDIKIPKRINKNKKAMTQEEILSKNGASSDWVKEYVIKNQLLNVQICDICRKSEYNNRKFKLQLDHINGDSKDHRLENLRLICYNCHSQTSTFAGRQLKGRRSFDPQTREPITSFRNDTCIKCGNPVRDKLSKRCYSCYLITITKITISAEELLTMVNEKGYKYACEKFNCKIDSIKDFLKRNLK